jgi:hypothetical protein
MLSLSQKSTANISNLVANILGLIRDAPGSILSILTEVNNTRVVVAALQRFLDKTHSLPPQRAALIQLDDLVVILTQTVLVFSELESLILPLSNQTKVGAVEWAARRQSTNI